jgi:hypothetical protein
MYRFDLGARYVYGMYHAEYLMQQAMQPEVVQSASSQKTSRTDII